MPLQQQDYMEEHRLPDSPSSLTKIALNRKSYKVLTKRYFDVKNGAINGAQQWRNSHTGNEILRINQKFKISTIIAIYVTQLS